MKHTSIILLLTTAMLYFVGYHSSSFAKIDKKVVCDSASVDSIVVDSAVVDSASVDNELGDILRMYDELAEGEQI